MQIELNKSEIEDLIASLDVKMERVRRKIFIAEGTFYPNSPWCKIIQAKAKKEWNDLTYHLSELDKLKEKLKSICQ